MTNREKPRPKPKSERPKIKGRVKPFVGTSSITAFGKGGKIKK